ncbi:MULTISPECIES: sensor histidine kinase [Amycolatopsis]|uniref:Oxygen sensor histidine kinase NreB n=1 Tax=Amycolatopsis tucumanensis TaxID=401106 RepID=A0ABP7IR94_9PSEU|nr:sensor histidine kinase [Amycolatopsis tucumanensis]MCF6427592.1 sensor histidine kinase [Amycolatopsis tucumanensis]
MPGVNRRSWTQSLDFAEGPGGPLSETWSRLVDHYLPYLLLGLATLLVHRADTLPLAGAALAWLLLTGPAMPRRWRSHGITLAVSFAGTLTLASLLMFRDVLFLVFMLTCFFGALRLKPAPLGVLALATTSLLINTIGAGGPGKALSTEPVLWVTIVTVQTGAICFGTIISRKVSEQNEARRAALEQLEAAQAENAGLHRQLLAQAREAGVMEERQRLSLEIHDTLAQGFTGIITQLEAAEQDPGEWRRRVATATALARENLAEARRSVHALRPGPLDEARLPDALKAVAERWAQRSEVAIEFTATGTARPMHPEIEATLLRVAQEALSNVAKHAGARRVGLTLSYMEDQVTLDVRDDGSGFDPARRGDGFGLPGMLQRVQRLAGTLAVESEPGAGTAISASLPAIGAA